MDPLEKLLRPLTGILNRNISETTPARDLCRKLDDKIIAIRVRDTGLAMYFLVNDEVLTLKSAIESEPDVVLTGSLLTLARMAGPAGEESDGAPIRSGSLDITGDAYTAQNFQQLLKYAKPDVEEELSQVVGDAAAHRAGQFARGFRAWVQGVRDTIHSDVREYLQEESRDVPSRYEVERFANQVDALRDDVARLEARINRLAGGA
ncbi:MAG: SCP2 sterol-binding domain-containing protein [Woeseiaceae bacterium]